MRFGYDFVTIFDALHDMGDPVGAAEHVRESLAPDGTWMIVEPYANDSLQGNINPVGRIYYSASTVICVPASKDQETGLAQGAQVGEARLREVVTADSATSSERRRRLSTSSLRLVRNNPGSGEFSAPCHRRGGALWQLKDRPRIWRR